LVEKIEILTPTHFVFEERDEGGGNRGVKIWNKLISSFQCYRPLFLLKFSRSGVLKFQTLLSFIVSGSLRIPKTLSGFMGTLYL